MNIRVKKQFWAGIVAILIWIWPALSFAQTLTLTAINQNPADKSWELSFMAPQPVTVHHFMLNNPERYVIDVDGAKALQIQLNSAGLLNTPIQKIRSSSKAEQHLRIVLDLKAKIPENKIQINFVKSLPKQTKQNQIVTVTAAQNTQAPLIIVIDPGHGGKDPGATGPKKIHEKDIVLSIAKKLQILINQQPGYKAVLTRDGDYYLTLRQRLAIARHYQAKLFIAIHADAYPDPLSHGFSVFALSQRGATSEAARWLAARENQSELMGGVDLNDKGDMLRSVLINLSQTATIQSSLLIGQNLLDHVHTFAPLHHDSVEQAAFVVLKSPDIPSLLVETGFLSNAGEEKKLKNPNYQYNLARAMMLGINQYFNQHQHLR